MCFYHLINVDRIQYVNIVFSLRYRCIRKEEKNEQTRVYTRRNREKENIVFQVNCYRIIILVIIHQKMKRRKT